MELQFRWLQPEMPSFVMCNISGISLKTKVRTQMLVVWTVRLRDLNEVMSELYAFDHACLRYIIRTRKVGRILYNCTYLRLNTTYIIKNIITRNHASLNHFAHCKNLCRSSYLLTICICDTAEKSRLELIRSEEILHLQGPTI